MRCTGRITAAGASSVAFPLAVPSSGAVVAEAGPDTCAGQRAAAEAVPGDLILLAQGLSSLHGSSAVKHALGMLLVMGVSLAVLMNGRRPVCSTSDFDAVLPGWQGSSFTGC